MRPHYRSLIGLVLGLMLVSQATAAEMRYTIHKSYPEVVRAVEQVVNEPRSQPFKVPNLPAIVEPLDIVELTTTINPKSRRYKATMKVSKGALSLHHSVTVRGYATTYEVTAQIDIQWHGRSRLINRIAANRIVPVAECKFLELERCKILKLAADMDTPEVELAEDSWLKVMVAAYKVMKRAMELKQ